MLDVMPAPEGVLGVSNPRYPHALATTRRHGLRGRGDAEQRIRVVTAASFRTTELVSVASRGGGGAFHRDLADMVAMVDGRASLVGEMESEPADLRAFVAAAFEKLFSGGREEPVGYHLPSDSASQARLRLVLDRCRELTAVAPRQRERQAGDLARSTLLRPLQLPPPGLHDAWLGSTAIDQPAPIERGPRKGALRRALYLGLLGHGYDGGGAREDVALDGRVWQVVAELHGGRLGKLEEDLVHELRNATLRLPVDS